MRAASAVLVCLATAPAQSLQQVREQLREAARNDRYPAFLASLLGLAQEQALNGGRLRIDGGADAVDTDLTVFALPLEREWQPGAGGLRFLVEASAAYVSARVATDDLYGGGVPGLATSIASRFEALGAFGGIGPLVELGSGFALAPLLSLGLADIRNRTNYGGPGAATSAALLDGILFNWDDVYGLYGGSALLRHRGAKVGRTELEFLVRYDLRRADPLSPGNAAQNEETTSDWAVARVDAERPTGWRIDDRAVRWTGRLGYKRLLGDMADLVGFRDYAEVGTGLVWASGDLVPGLSQLGVHGSVFVGEEVRGWSLGVAVRF